MKKRLKTVEGPALLWKRLAAFAIDVFIFDIIVVSFFRRPLRGLIPIGNLQDAISFARNSSLTGQLTLILIVLGVFAVLYFSIQEFKFGDTIGKKILKIYVKSENKKLNYWQCLVRSLYWIPVFPLMLLWIIDPIMALFTDKNRRLSEMMSKTYTVGIFVMNY